MKVSNADRIVFPEPGLTKGDVVAHYERVADAMLPHLVGAPLTLERFPKGIAGGGFMQKNAPAHYPDSIKRYEVPKKGGTTTYPVVYLADDLPYLANQGTITFHAWTSAIPDVMLPGRFVIDLDPPPDAIEAVRASAHAVRDILDELGLPSVPVATGSKGYHLVVPILRTVPFEDISRLTHTIAMLATAIRPDLMTQEFRIENRGGRVFVDWLRNTPGSTTVVPWSLRPRPMAPVAVPIEWDALDTFPPDGLTLSNVSEVLVGGDPLAKLAESAVDAMAAVAAADTLLESRGLELKSFDRFRS